MFGGSIFLPNTDPSIDLVWAPGYDVTVADARVGLPLPDGTTATTYRPGSGTSEGNENGASVKADENGTDFLLAAASVAGLCAYFLGLTDIDDDIRPGPNPIDNANAMGRYLRSMSVRRPAPANTLSIWNGVLLSDNPGSCPLQPIKRQDASVDPAYSTCSVSSSPSSTQSTSSTPSSTSSVCSTTTASICTDSVTFGVDGSGSTTTTVSHVTCTPTAGCSATGSTTTVFATSVAPKSTGPTLPSPTNVDLGILQCFTSADEMSAQDAVSAQYALCHACVSSGAIFKDGGTPIQAIEVGATTASATWNGGSNCPTLDFKNDEGNAFNACIDRLNNIVSDCEHHSKKSSSGLC